jgi:hypothetical protein
MIAMRNPFTAHPREVGESYLGHAFFAVRYGVKMAAGGIAAVVHGVFPFAFRTTASRITEELAAQLAESRRRARNPGEDR